MPSLAVATRSMNARSCVADRGQPLLPALGEQIDQQRDPLAIEAIGGLVEQQQIGIPRERREEARAAALPEREAAEALAEDCADAKALDLRGRRGRASLQRGDERDELRHAQMRR